MAKSHPYISGVCNITKMVTSLRKSFPSVVNSETVKKLGYAPNNESYVINSLQFVGVLNSEGKKTDEAALAFSSHKDEDFAKNFQPLVKNAYSELFDLHGENAWALDKNSLITFFRKSDDTGAAIGSRQAAVFQTFASLSGYGTLAEPKAQSSSVKLKPAKVTSSEKTLIAKQAANKNSEKISEPFTHAQSFNTKKNNIQMTVRLEINIPADGTKETYDNIFRSIKENLLND